MRIFAVSDLHGDFRKAQKLAEQAEKEKADVVVICGDLFQYGIETQGMLKPFVEKNKEIIIVHGNHDDPILFNSIAKEYNIKNIHGSATIINDIGFFGCGGADVGWNISEDSEMFYYLEKGFNKIKNAKKKIMITHMHPSETNIEKISFKGSKSIRRALEKFEPDIHFCGHIHEAEGMEENVGKTRIISVGANGKVIDV